MLKSAIPADHISTPNVLCNYYAIATLMKKAGQQNHKHDFKNKKDESTIGRTILVNDFFYIVLPCLWLPSKPQNIYFIGSSN